MKVISFICTLLVTISCATKLDRTHIEDSRQNPIKTYEEKKMLIKQMISSHNEFDQATKDKLEKSLLRTIDRAKALKERESQLIQEVLKQSLVKKASYDNMVVLKKELKKLYNRKYSNLERAIIELKQVIGIKPINESLSRDIRMEYLFFR
jgi:hypothetical protein